MTTQFSRRVFELLAEHAALQNCITPATERGMAKYEATLRDARERHRQCMPSEYFTNPEIELAILDKYGYLLSLSRKQDPDIFKNHNYDKLFGKLAIHICILYNMVGLDKDSKLKDHLDSASVLRSIRPQLPEYYDSPIYSTDVPHWSSLTDKAMVPSKAEYDYVFKKWHAFLNEERACFTPGFAVRFEDRERVIRLHFLWREVFGRESARFIFKAIAVYTFCCPETELLSSSLAKYEEIVFKAARDLMWALRDTIVTPGTRWAYSKDEGGSGCPFDSRTQAILGLTDGSLTEDIIADKNREWRRELQQQGRQARGDAHETDPWAVWLPDDRNLDHRIVSPPITPTADA